jgi:multisubunit Na+/H+ antiporter MnhB subunit
MIELLLLAVAFILYWIAQKYFSTKEDEFVCFETAGTFIVILATFLFMLATLLAVNNAYLLHDR